MARVHTRYKTQCFVSDQAKVKFWFAYIAMRMRFRMQNWGTVPSFLNRFFAVLRGTRTLPVFLDLDPDLFSTQWSTVASLCNFQYRTFTVKWSLIIGHAKSSLAVMNAPRTISFLYGNLWKKKHSLYSLHSLVVISVLNRCCYFIFPTTILR